jgi:gliding motility-associated-like protein
VVKNFTILAKPIAEQQIDTVCQGLPTSFNSISYTPKGSIQKYLWEMGDGNKDTIAQFKHTYATSGDYKVILEVISDKGCRDTNTRISHVADLPLAVFSSDLIEGCTPQNIQFTSESSIKNGNIRKWYWSFGDGNFATNEAPSNNYIKTGKHNVTLKVKSQLNCTDSITKLDYITIHPKPTLDFSYSPDTPSYIFPDIFLEDKSPSVLYEWTWQVNGNTIGNWRETDYTFPDTGNYVLTLIGKDTNDCKDTITKNVYISPIVILYLPNAFTPNDNNLNDVFKPEGIFLGITDYSFQVYNRWGELLFSSTDPEIGWDGKMANKTVQQGMYIYQIRYTDYLRTKWYESSGEIYILK